MFHVADDNCFLVSIGAFTVTVQTNSCICCFDVNIRCKLVCAVVVRMSRNGSWLLLDSLYVNLSTECSFILFMISSISSSFASVEFANVVHDSAVNVRFPSWDAETGVFQICHVEIGKCWS